MRKQYTNYEQSNICQPMAGRIVSGGRFFPFKKQWESFQGERECFENDAHMPKRKRAARFAMGIEEGIQAF